METIEKQDVQKLVPVDNQVNVYINEDIHPPFMRVFHFPSNPDSFLGHMDIWNDHAPFYFLWTTSDQSKKPIKGYHKSYFVENHFRIGYDKHSKMYLRADKTGNIRLMYHPIKDRSDKLKIDEFKKRGRFIVDAYEESSINSEFIHGEAIELIDINK